MEGVVYSGITEVATFLLLHSKGVDNLLNTKLHAKFNELTADNPCTKIELSLEVSPTVLQPLSELLTGICGLQGLCQLASDYHANLATQLEVELLACINGTIAGHYTGTPLCDGGDIRPASSSSLSLSSFTGVCVRLHLPMDAACRWSCAKHVARFYHLLCVANTKVTFMVSYYGDGQHRMVEYQAKDHMTINLQGHTLMTTLHPHYCHDAGRRNKLRAVRGKKQMIGGVRTRSGDAVTLQMSVVCAAAPGLPSLARGQKLPADRLCRAINVMVYGPGGVPVFPPSSHRGLLLSQLANWEDYGVAIGNRCPTECTGNNFDQMVTASFSNELIVTKDSTRVSVVERNCVLYVFLFIEPVVESVDVSSTDSTRHQIISLKMLQHELEDIQLSHVKQFRTATHASLNKLLCNYNSFSKINSSLEEAIPSVSEAVVSIISHSRTESFQHSCQRLMEGVDPTGDEAQQWLTDRLWRIASDKLGAQYHNGQLIRSAEEPDTPDIMATVTTAAPSHRSSPDICHRDNTLVTDLEMETVVSVSRRCYHPTRISPHHHYTSQADSVSSENDCIMAESFTTLGIEDLEWSDTDHTTGDDITDDELWSDDNTVVNDDTLWDDDNNASTHSTTTTPVVSTSSLQDILTYATHSNEPLLHGEVLLPPDNDITTNEMSGVNESATEIATDTLAPDRVNNINNKVIPIKVPSILTCDEMLTATHDGSTTVSPMDNYSQPIVLLSKESSSEDVETCFDELADLPSSPEPEAMMTENNNTFDSNSSPALLPNNMSDITGILPMENQYLMDQLSGTEVDDDCVAEDFDWN